MSRSRDGGVPARPRLGRQLAQPGHGDSLAPARACLPRLARPHVCPGVGLSVARIPPMALCPSPRQWERAVRLRCRLPNRTSRGAAALAGCGTSPVSWKAGAVRPGTSDAGCRRMRIYTEVADQRHKSVKRRFRLESRYTFRHGDHRFRGDDPASSRGKRTIQVPGRGGQRVCRKTPSGPSLEGTTPA